MKTARLVIFFGLLIVSTVLNAQNCTNWLRVPTQPSFVRVGDLDIPGNVVTVEAIFNRTAPWMGADVFQGDLVSKHEDQTDCNYLLRPSSAEITTSNGYFKTPVICPIQLNKTYHAAMVYNGSSLKFYRNGFLMSQIPATGNLIQNNWQTQIGLYFNQLTQENFIGYINEVRIWNIARTQSELRTYMNQSLPSPTTTTGLLAYYTFNNLLNKQGNPTWNGTVNGSASINQTNPSCTMVIDSCNIIPVDVCATFTINKLKDTSICKGKSVVLDATSLGAVSYSWLPGLGLSDPNIANPIASPNVSTEYYLNISNSIGCNKADTVFVKVNNYPFVDNIPDTTICPGSSAVLNSQGVGYTTLTWQPLAGLSSGSVPNPIASPLVSTQYIVIADNLGCSVSDTVNLLIGDRPVLIPLPDSTICPGESVNLNSNLIGASNFTWTPSSGLSNPFSISPDASPNTTTQYILSANSLDGCTISDSVIITVKNSVVFNKPQDINLCLGDSAQLKSSNNGFTHVWSPSTYMVNPNVQNPIVFPLTDIDFTVNVSDPVCNTDTNFVVAVKVHSLPNIKVIKDNDISCSFPVSQLLATGGLIYEWTPSNGVNFDNVSNPIVRVDTSTIFTVMGMDQFGCKNYDTVTVKVSYAGKLFMQLPDAFTPNRDGKNDCFGVKQFGSVSDLEFSIFNRWGQVVFYTNDPNHCWDGTYKGKIQGTGVFVYLVKGKSTCGNIFLKGTVTLIR